MSKDDTKKSKEQSIKKNPTKPKGRSFCCSIFIYTFVFVSGVVVATILPDLAGHHFKQPYGKEYGVMAEQIFQNLPKYFKSWSETAVVLARDLVDRVWVLKAEVERRIADMNNKKDDTKKSKTVTQRPTSRTTTQATLNKDHVHTARTHDTKKASATANDRPTKTNEF